MPRGAQPGERRGGRPPGSKNKATLEREAQALLDRARIEEIDRLQAAGVPEATAAAATGGVKLMKDIAMDFARVFAGLAAFYQPWPKWIQDATTGAIRNANPNFNETKFKEYSLLATQTALGAAPYESPRLSAMMVGSAIVNEIEIIGGLPDDEDGGLNAGPTIDGTIEPQPGSEPGASSPGVAAAITDQSTGQPADVPPEAGGAVPTEGEAEGSTLRKAVG